MKWTCFCGDDEFGDVLAVLNHMRLMHPDIEVTVERWSDGAWVIYDEL